MISLRVASLTLFAMLAFAGNSLLCRIALRDTAIDAASFTSIRLASGALVLAAPPLVSAACMLAAGASWAVYSVLGRGVKDAVGATAGNFLRSLPFAVVLSLATVTDARVDPAGVGYAVLSGAITSGLGYVL